MFEGHDRIILELVGGGLVGPVELEHAWEGRAGDGRTLTDILLERGLLEKAALLRTVAAHLGATYVDAVPGSLPAETVALLDRDFARARGVIPWRTDGTAIEFLAVDPLDLQLMDDLAFALDREVRLAVADPEAVAGLVRRHYGDDGESARDMVGSRLEEETQRAGRDDDLSAADIEQLAGAKPIVRFVNEVLARAIRDRASDVHFEPFEREFKVRCRVDGVLHELTPPPRSHALPVISRLKVLANLDIAERRVPQDGRIKLTVAGRAVDLRVSTLPTQFGESLVLRVLDQAAVRLELGQLGLPVEIEPAVLEIIRRPHGIFVVTGPTGSGKTTTLYSCLRELNTIDAKILTVEDPVEYEVDGLMQVAVNPAAGLTFARALRGFLRQDPDIVMVGEIRDLETAQIAVQAALTGHLVLTTLHTNDAPGAVVRLADLGIEPFLLGATIEAVLAQRLVRRLCPDCRAVCPPSDHVVRLMGADAGRLAGRPLFQARGCPACHGTGYRGRIGFFEFLRLTEPLRELIVAGAAPAVFRRRATELGMIPLREAGVRAILAGETTPEEVVRYT